MGATEHAEAMARMNVISTEVLAEYAARGIPEEEVNQDDLLQAILHRLNRQELAALHLIPPLTDDEDIDEWGTLPFVPGLDDSDDE